MLSRNLTNGEIQQVVYGYIGVEAGYLGDFTYASHRRFYIEYDLDYDPDAIDDTTRGRFTHILTKAPPVDQARILEGVLDKYPAGSAKIRTQAQADKIHGFIKRLRAACGVESQQPLITSDVVERAINDAEALLQTQGATSAVDRAHTALHGYLKAVCNDEAIGYGKDPKLNQLLKIILDNHSAFQHDARRQQDIKQILRSLNGILDALNPIRNRGSVAHPNESLLEEPEAMLAINAARTVLHYIDSRISFNTQ